MSDLAVRRWEFAPLAGQGGSAATDFDARRRQATEEGYQAGHRAGMAAAQAIAQRLGELLASSEQALRLMEERLAGELVDLAVDLARHVVRAEITARREAILPVAREALALLAQEARTVQIVVHPSDAQLLNRSLSQDIARGGWQVVEDNRVEPGGVRIVSSTGDVDATLATRWRRVLSALGRDHPWHEAGE
jgi:flagellar assembly protein FliH